MTRVMIIGATGSLGAQVARLAVAADHAVSVLVRQPNRLAPELADSAAVRTGDLRSLAPAAIAACVANHDVLISCAGHVADGAAMLDIAQTGRRGIDLPKVRDTYWPHKANFERLQRSDLEWRLLCPGPMVDRPAPGSHCDRGRCALFVTAVGFGV